MADLPAAVCDTHALSFTPPAAIVSAAAQRCTSTPASSVRRSSYVPAAVIWECGLLARASRVNLRRTVRAFFDDLQQPGLPAADLTAAQVFLADETRINRDPFDALICAAAIDLHLPFITRDADIRGAGVVKVVW